MHAIQPSIHHGGNAGAIGRSGPRQEPAPTTAPTGSPPVTDEVTLSPQAKAFIEGEGPGKSGSSPAHRARAAIAADPELAAMPFGKVVSGINHGVDSTPAAAPEPEPAPVPVDEGGDTPPADPVADAPAPAAPVVEEGTTPVAADPNPLADIQPLVDPGPEVSLLETLDAAIDDAGDETSDESGGVDIAA